MPCICGKCDAKKNTTLKFAMAARDLARLLEVPQQLMLVHGAVVVEDATDEWPVGMTRVVVAMPHMTDADVVAAVDAFYARPSPLTALLDAIRVLDQMLDDTGAN